jgi:tripartite-type tricarboxylate transporter receptor subunit TctC
MAASSNSLVVFLQRLTAAGCALLCAPAASAAEAQTYPSRPVTFIIPFAAGSSTDAVARLVAQNLQSALGQTFLVENRVGAGGMLAASAVARAPGDGYTLLLTTNSTHSAANGLFKTVPYDPIRDFTPVARIGGFPNFVAIHPQLPIRTPAELIAYARANPRKLNYGIGNSTGHIVGETLKRRTGIDMVRVSYRSNPMAVPDLIAGRISVMFLEFTTGMPQIRAQTVRPIAMITKDRSHYLPDLPTLNETVTPGFDIMPWVGIFGPANMPAEIVKLLARELEKMVSKPEIREQFITSGMDVYWIGHEQFPDFVQSELVKWSAMIKEAGIEPE